MTTQEISINAELSHDFEGFVKAAVERGICGAVIETTPLQQMAYAAVWDIAFREGQVYDFDTAQIDMDQMLAMYANGLPKLLEKDYGGMETAIVYHGESGTDTNTSLAIQLVVPTPDMIENGLNATFMVYSQTDKGFILTAVGGFEDDSTFISEFPEHGIALGEGIMEALCGKALQSMLFALSIDEDA